MSILLKENMKLTPQDMADFFNIKLKTYRDTSKKKQELFKQYADYHFEPKDKQTNLIVIDRVIKQHPSLTPPSTEAPTLTPGFMSISDLSAWFGLSPQTLARSKPETRAKKMERLKAFCKYRQESNRGIIIEEIYNPTYSRAFDFIEEHYEEEWGRGFHTNPALKIDTGTRVGSALYHTYPEINMQVAESTAINYTNRVKVTDYGTTSKHTIGRKGYSEYIYLNKDGSAVLDAASMQIIEESRNEVYQNASKIWQELDMAVELGEITQEEKEKYFRESRYSAFVTLVIEKLGYFPVIRTRLYTKAF